MNAAISTIKPPLQGIRGFRWTVCGLIFAATTINYMDRQVLGILAPTLEKALGWNELE
jgi:ACS family hexuronate transporter-like MFS transporter